MAAQCNPTCFELQSYLKMPFMKIAAYASQIYPRVSGPSMWRNSWDIAVSLGKAQDYNTAKLAQQCQFYFINEIKISNKHHTAITNSVYVRCQL